MPELPRQPGNGHSRPDYSFVNAKKNVLKGGNIMANINEIKQTIGESVEKVREQLDDAKEQWDETAEKVKEKGEQTWRDVSRFVQKNPGQAIGLSLLVGALVGALWASRDRD